MGKNYSNIKITLRGILERILSAFVAQARMSKAALIRQRHGIQLKGVVLLKILNFCPYQIVTGRGSIHHLKDIRANRTLIVSGAKSMRRAGVIDKITGCLSSEELRVLEGIANEPSISDIEKGLAVMREFQPDTVIAVGGGSVLDAAKGMLLFYEFPWLSFERIQEETIPPKREKTQFIAIPSTSGTGSEVTRTSVITDPKKQLKVPIINICLKPDVAILDADLVDGMPKKLVAETGMDALTHALECYLRHDLDDFDEVLAKGAVEGILKWLPESYLKGTPESREKVHNYQSIAGISFTNVGVALVHGIAHAVGAYFHMPHGLANAIILPYVTEFNRQDERVRGKLAYLSKLCGCEDIVRAIWELDRLLEIPPTLQKAGIAETDFLEAFDKVAQSSLLGATRFNPVPVDLDTMKSLLKTVYYGKQGQA